MPYILGLTGSIAMGKSTVSDIFRKHKCPVLDSDKVVHQLYSKNGAAVALVEEAFGGVTIDGSIDRQLLSAHVVNNKEALARLEIIVHPLVREEKYRFLDEAAAAGEPLVVLDVPLLFETGYEKECDSVAVVSASAEVQSERALARPGMTAEKFDGILARQMPDEEKRRRADYVIDTGVSIEQTEAQVAELIAALKTKSGTVYAALKSKPAENSS